jgi:hypothetical protein
VDAVTAAVCRGLLEQLLHAVSAATALGASYLQQQLSLMSAVGVCCYGCEVKLMNTAASRGL